MRCSSVKRLARTARPVDVAARGWFMSSKTTTMQHGWHLKHAVPNTTMEPGTSDLTARSMSSFTCSSVASYRFLSFLKSVELMEL